MLNRTTVPARHLQSQSIDQFFYFFLGLRKGEIRGRVKSLSARHPDEDPQQLARRLVNAQLPLALLGGALLDLPLLLPGAGTTLKLLGVASGASTLIRLHLSLILEIALLFGHDIDDRARLKDMWVVMCATGLAAGAPFAARTLGLRQWYSLLAGTLSLTAINRLIGESAIVYYRRLADRQSSEDNTLTDTPSAAATGVRSL